jgi:hypothetical protein
VVPDPAPLAPTRLAIGFAPGSGNPSTGDLSLSCALPAGGPARLEIIDLVGRVVLRRRIDSAQAGIVIVPIARSDLPRAGVYFARIQQGASTARLRFVRIAG